MKRKLTALLLAVLTLCLCTGAMAAGYPSTPRARTYP